MDITYIQCTGLKTHEIQISLDGKTADKTYLNNLPQVKTPA